MSIFNNLAEKTFDVSEGIKDSVVDIYDSTEGISTGYPGLDSLCGGLRKGHLYLLGSETGSGKSVFIANILVNLAKSNIAKSIYFDLENGRVISYKRLLMIMGDKSSKFFEDESTKPESEQIAQEFRDKIYLFDRKHLKDSLNGKDSLAKAQAIGQLIEDYVIQKGISVAVVDPLKQFELTAESTENFVAMGKVVDYFADLAVSLKITIFLIHHLRKITSNSNQVKDIYSTEETVPKYRIPTENDFKGSGDITSTATDIWCFVRQIHDPDTSMRGRVLFRILKGRENQLGDVRFTMDQNTLRFREWLPNFLQNNQKSNEQIKQESKDFIEQQKKEWLAKRDRQEMEGWEPYDRK